MQSFESTNDFQRRNESLTKNVKRSKSELMKLLNDEQLKAFKKYVFCLYQYDSAEKAEYFSEGFMMGYFSRDLAILDED